MRFAFWKKPDASKLDTFSWNLMVAAIDSDQCWKIAGLFRNTGMPSNLLVCETSFLMGSIVRDIIRSTVPELNQRACITSAESAYYKTFDEQSADPLPAEMAKVYGSLTLVHVARIALASYGEQNDLLSLTSGALVRRIKGDPRMKYEVMPLFEELSTPGWNFSFSPGRIAHPAGGEPSVRCSLLPSGPSGSGTPLDRSGRALCTE